jgi:serine/threonine protein kinase
MNPPVIHRDMKSLNVFMTKQNGRWVAKVADFGLSRTPDSDMMTSALGTLVLFYLFSIGWPLNYLVTNSTR